MSQMSNRTRRGLRSLIVYLVTLALISTSISTVFADEPSKDYKSSIDSALNWLSTNQSPDGSWGDGSNLRDTSEIAGYLKENSYHADSVSKAGIWLCSQDAINNDFAAHELQFINDKKTHNEMLNNLLSTQNDDGGWGLAQYFESDVLDTVIVLEALLSEKSPNLEAIKKGISYIINNQDSSGGWSYLPGSSCEIFLTAKTALLLGNFTRITGLGGTELSTSIKRSSEYLVSNQLPDKTWGTDIDSLPGTLIAYRVLLRGSGIKAVSSLEDTILSLQDKDGSFSKDA
ncbi:MAG TPA: prenyltransferase/squalene oxidase repeat-containing protein, partial [Clostridia bacterium]